jgi:hypothetical protein
LPNSRATIALVASFDPSSATITSIAGYVARQHAAHRSLDHRSSLYAGMITDETSG